MKTSWLGTLQADPKQSTMCSQKPKGVFLFARVMPHVQACQMIIIGWINQESCPLGLRRTLESFGGGDRRGEKEVGRRLALSNLPHCCIEATLLKVQPMMDTMRREMWAPLIPPGSGSGACTPTTLCH